MTTPVWLHTPRWYSLSSPAEAEAVAALIRRKYGDIVVVRDRRIQTDISQSGVQEEIEIVRRRGVAARATRGSRRTPSERLFIGVFPGGISYADRSREKHGDYAKCAFLPYDTLELEIERDCPAELRPLIEKDAARIQARRGQQYQVSASGQTVLLGGGRSRSTGRSAVRTAHGRKYLSVTYSRTTPESAAEGDTSDSGHLEDIEVEVDEYDREEGITAVDIVVKALQKAGATEPSSSQFHPGIWYSTEYEVVSYRTGEEEERSFHLKGFSAEEQREIYSQVTRRRR